MRLLNETRTQPLMSEGRLANNFWTRLKGLIGVRTLPEGEGLLIAPCTSVHTMFMSIPIDVLHVDKEYTVLAMVPDMAPWRVGPIVRRSRYVVELPAGTIARTGTQVGDKLAKM
ncbi:MAG: DUF192 domain-containing protein [Caldilineaceae bacterium]